MQSTQTAERERSTSGRYRVFTRHHLEQIPQIRDWNRDQLTAMKAVAAVLPFRVNNYVLNELIDWDDIPQDPIFQLTFPQEGMLARADFERMHQLVRRGAPESEIRAQAREIQLRLNPHPSCQRELNVPKLSGEPIPGLQHKYRETVLFFPSQGQTCHAYCTYCFRWAQFVGIKELKFANREVTSLVKYLRQHPEVTSVLFTGGDPLIMKTSVLRAYVEPLLEADLEHVTSIRLGTKAPAYWPERFLGDADADDLLRLFEQARDRGRHLALMAHFSHPRELMPVAAQRAILRIQNAGAVVRCQAPVIRHVNDDASTWSDMWGEQVRLGAVPYYMFVERNTGPKRYFEVPLELSLEIFQQAYRTITGLGRTVRGPSMSASPGKVVVDGIAEVAGERVFVLKFIQARDPDWVNRPFFAKYDPQAVWLDDLRPAFGEAEFFFERPFRFIKEGGHILSVNGNVRGRRSSSEVDRAGAVSGAL